MCDDFEDCEELVLELCALDKSKKPPARSVERPSWKEVDTALNQVYTNGGFVYVRVLKPESAYIRQLSMESIPNQFRLMVLTRAENPKEELLEWWEPGNKGFRGTIRFGDDDWDARTVSGELSVARQFFNDLYKYGKLTDDLLAEMRSQWNPKP